MSDAPNADGYVVEDLSEQNGGHGYSSTNEPRDYSSNVGQGMAGGSRYSQQPVQENNCRQQSSRASDVDTNIFFDSVATASSDTTLSIEGEKYIDEIDRILKPEGFTIKRLPNPGSFIITSENNTLAVPLIFQETLPHPNQPLKPYTGYIKKIQEDTMRQYRDKKQVIDPLMITPYDYPKAKSMSQSIMFMLRTTLDESANMNALQNCRYRIVTDQSRALSNLRQMNPNGVLPYTQYAVSVEVAKPSREIGFQRDDDSDWVPLFTVGGYTEFIKNRRDYATRGQTFTPLVNISSCAIRYTSIALLPLVIRVAYNSFITSGLWLSPFKHFNEGDYNLGQLAIDENGRPCFLSDSRQFYEFLDEAIIKPVLCLEITGGTFNYPALSLLTSQDGVEYLKRYLTSIASSKNKDYINNIPSPMIEGFIGYFTGVTRYDSQPVDTRTIDYFKICRGNVTNPALLNQFLRYTSVPEERLQAISDAGFSSIIDGREGVQSLYTTAKYVLRGDAVKTFMEITSFLNFPETPYTDRGNVFSTEMLRSVGDFLDKECYNVGRYGGNSYFGARPVFGDLYNNTSFFNR